MFNKRLGYIIDRINSATILEYPFEHIEIDNLFKDKDFNKVIDLNDFK